MYSTRQYRFENSNIIFSIPIYERIMLIVGDSATGKSYICKQIKASKANKKTINQVRTNIKLENTYVISTPLELQAIQSMEVKGSLIIIDRYSIIATPESNEFVNNSDNIFILMYRGGPRVSTLEVRSTSFVTLKQAPNKSNKYTLICEAT